MLPLDSYYSNADELFSVIQHEWNAIPDMDFTSPTDSMSNRAGIVKGNNGKSTK